VQGVGFRAWTQTEARRCGVTGWVRNEPDGSVSVLISGPKDAVHAMLERVRSGPPGAMVSGVATEPAETCGFEGFQVRR
jgi:acylphosphatase